MNAVKTSTKTTLVLNGLYMPISVTVARHVMHQMTRNRVKCLDKSLNPWSAQDWLYPENDNLPEYLEDQPTLASASKEWPIPTIVIAKDNYFTPIKKKGGKISIKQLAEHHGNICVRCGGVFPTSKLTKDHAIPRSKGGPDDDTNLVPMCKPCNSMKGDAFPYYAHDGIAIHEKVKKNPILLNLKPSDIREEWKVFLFKE